METGHVQEEVVVQQRLSEVVREMEIGTIPRIAWGSYAVQAVYGMSGLTEVRVRLQSRNAMPGEKGRSEIAPAPEYNR